MSGNHFDEPGQVESGKNRIKANLEEGQRTSDSSCAAIHSESIADNEGILTVESENEKTPRNIVFLRGFDSDADGARTRNLWRDRPDPATSSYRETPNEINPTDSRYPDRYPSESNFDAWLAELAADLREQLNAEQLRVLVELLTDAE